MSTPDVNICTTPITQKQRETRLHPVISYSRNVILVLMSTYVLHPSLHSSRKPDHIPRDVNVCTTPVTQEQRETRLHPVISYSRNVFLVLMSTYVLHPSLNSSGKPDYIPY
ncbi:hypothetical protein J6590_029808 [Homalodisca vitripennis]|nr:hypothetical protein J6590_029808 [Homalodisca vitripennis]